MANKKQLRILRKQGVEAWNKLLSGNRGFFNIPIDPLEIDLSDADLIGADLSGANLREADLWRADLTGANLSDADLIGADLSGANLSDADLSGANLWGANLREADLWRADLTGANLREANLREAANLRRANFLGANLRELDLNGVKFIEVDLSEANLSGANLSGANLIAAQALYTNFNDATLTGACIEDWNINSKTNLENVICDYIYLKEGKQERRPSDPNRNFEPGEFAKLVEKYLETVDLIFKDGIDWQTFLTAFQELQIESESGELLVQAIERKTGGSFVIRVEVPADSHNEKIETSFWNKYQPLLEAKDSKIKLLSQQTEFYSQQVEVIRQDNTRLLGIVETMAEKESSKVNMTFNAPVTGVAGNVEGNQNIFTSQSIAQASTEIQNLLNTLQNNGLTQEQAEGVVANNLATQAKDNPTLKGKLVNWGKSLGDKAAETSVSEVVRRVIKLALNLAGVPMP